LGKVHSLIEVHCLTSQNPGHHSMEKTMLLSIELAQERIRDMERRLAERHPAIRPDVARHSRQEAAAEAVRRSPVEAIREIGHPIRRLLGRAGGRVLRGRRMDVA
jgi:hypothetical protein